MRIDPAAEMARHHLRAEADAEIRLLVAQRHADPVGLTLDEVVVVVGALRPAEDHRAGMFVHRLGQRIVEARPADVERIAELGQHLPDTAGRGMLLMQDDKDGLEHVGRQIALADTYRFRADLESLRRLCARRAAALCRRSITLSSKPRGTNETSSTTARLSRPGTTSRFPSIKPR